MKIGVDIRTLSFRKGGLSQYTYNVLNNIVRIDLKNEYYLFNYNKSQYEWDNFRGNVKEIILRLPQRYKFKEVWENILTPIWIKKLGINMWFSPSDYYVPDLWQVPTVMTVPDLICKKNFDIATKEILKQSPRTEKLDSAVKNASQIITISHFSHEEIRKEYGIDSSKISTIFLAAHERFHKIDDQAFISRVLRRYGINFNYILFVGETSERKNLIRLLRAYHQLKTANKTSGRKLLIVGKKTCDTDKILHEVKKLNLMPDVFFTGYIPDEDLPFIYNAADLFVFPSLYEGFGLPLLEAMNCQIPVVASCLTAIPEVAGNGALLFDPYDIEDIADKLDKVLNKKIGVDELIRKGMVQTTKFTWEKTAKQVVDIFNVINSHEFQRTH